MKNRDSPEELRSPRLALGISKCLREVLSGVEMHCIDSPPEKAAVQVVQQGRTQSVCPAGAVALVSSVDVASKSLAATSSSAERSRFQEVHLLKGVVKEDLVSV